MIRLIVDSLRTIIESISWVERYGGVAFPFPRFVEGVDGGAATTQVVPVGEYISQRDCHEETERYFYLVPDDSKKSIVYFEQAGDMVFSNTGRAGSRLRGVLLGRQSLRLVCWVNLDKIGSEFPTDTALLAAEMMGIVDGAKIGVLAASNQLPVTNIRWEVASEVPKSLAIFGQYSYNNKAAFLLYPYDFFALNVSVEFYLKKACLTAYATGDPLACVNIDEVQVLSTFGGGDMGGLGDTILTPQ